MSGVEKCAKFNIKYVLNYNLFFNFGIEIGREINFVLFSQMLEH